MVNKNYYLSETELGSYLTKLKEYIVYYILKYRLFDTRIVGLCKVIKYVEFKITYFQFLLLHISLTM